MGEDDVIMNLQIANAMNGEICTKKMKFSLIPKIPFKGRRGARRADVELAGQISFLFLSPIPSFGWVMKSNEMEGIQYNAEGE